MYLCLEGGNFALVNTLFFLVLPYSTLNCLFHPHVLKLGLKVQFLRCAEREHNDDSIFCTKETGNDRRNKGEEEMKD